MKASDVVKELEKLIKEHGDLKVYSDMEQTIHKIIFIPTDRFSGEEHFSLLLSNI